MKEQLISFKTAKLLRKHGVAWKSEQAYVYRYHEHESDSYDAPLTKKPLHCDISAPTQSLVQKWLREKHKLHINVHPHYDNFGEHTSWTINSINRLAGGSNVISNAAYDTYEEALEAGLILALNLIR